MSGALIWYQLYYLLYVGAEIVLILYVYPHFKDLPWKPYIFTNVVPDVTPLTNPNRFLSTDFQCLYKYNKNIFEKIIGGD